MDSLSVSKNSFDLERSLSCGQVFGWAKKGEWWQGCIENKPVRVRQAENGTLFFEGAQAKEIRRFFSLDFNLNAAQKELSKDAAMKKALACAKGLRIIRQEPFECGVSFICATFANIPRIQKMLFSLRRHFGKKASAFGEEFFLFPEPSALARASEKELKECGLGYRARYVKSFAEKFAKNKGELQSREQPRAKARGFIVGIIETPRVAPSNFGSLLARLKSRGFSDPRLFIEKLDYETAKRELIKHDGIGEKVADCVLLFSLGKGEAFPVDVWIRRAMLDFYGPKIRDKSNKGIADFARSKWGKSAGLAQEYLYCFARECGKRGKVGAKNAK